VNSLAKAVFVLEQHLGHRTYADSLKAAADLAGLEITWVDIHYRHSPAPWTRLPAGGRLAGTLAGRSEVRAGLRQRTDVQVFNTQVPAALAGSALRSPYVIVTDVTPLQYDRIASGYGHRPDRFGMTRTLKHRRNLSVFRNAVQCVAWSTWAAASIVEDYGVDQSRVTVVPPGVDTRMWLPATRGPRRPDDAIGLLFVGGEFERKGGDLLLEAIEYLGPRVRATIVTRSEVRPTDGVRVLHDITPNDPRLIAAYRAADVFVLPTRAETFGIAAVEAQAAGLPVIASDLGGLSDIVKDGVTGQLIDVGDVSALCDSISLLIDDAALRGQWARAARLRAVELFDARTNAGLLFSLVRDCCS